MLWMKPQSLTLSFNDAFLDFVETDVVMDHNEMYDWESNWDDEEKQVTFSEQLRAEVEKLK